MLPAVLVPAPLWEGRHAPSKGNVSGLGYSGHRARFVDFPMGTHARERLDVQHGGLPKPLQGVLHSLQPGPDDARMDRVQQHLHLRHAGRLPGTGRRGRHLMAG